MFSRSCIVFIVLVGAFFHLCSAMVNLTLPGQHPFPEDVAQDVHRKVNVSLSRRQMLSYTTNEQSSSCATGNPIDDCWRCDPSWQLNRQRLADCGIGFGQYALGGKGGKYYVVTDSSDHDPVNPTPGTLRYAVIQTEPLWIVFATNMLIHLSEELIFNSYKTLDGRGAHVHITGGGCITLQDITNVIIHNIHIHHCYEAGETNIRSSPTHYGWRTKSDGDGISIFGAHDIWIDHCSLSHCKDGLIDAVMGSTGITISNNHFSHHNEVMLLGHSDDYLPDSGMQVTIAFNHFGKKLIQRMPRCRKGYIHVVNNDFTQWEMYAIGGSGNPTINSQGNRYIAPFDRNAKEVTKRVDTEEESWRGWNWRSEGDEMVNGAYFVASGQGVEVKYEKAYSVEPKSAAYIDQLVMNSGVLTNSGHNLGKWSARDNGGGTDLDANSGVVEDYDEDEDSGSCRTHSYPILSSLLINLSIFLFLHVTATSMLL
ncbi:probable pectate lyase 12 [Olea europaea var. sylvestris]|uniref:probable pectate lyase 12 n=1 Tax=Olea europaea var. sylvestris TaxID=158386 RepID=UPI000C1D1249|nr:probable pectate lyase 12 [Olea europaea var. sylvestris]